MVLHRGADADVITPFQPEGLEQAWQLAERLATATILPPAYRQRPADAFAAILLGRDLGLSPMQSMLGIHVIDGKPSVSAQTAVALVKRSPLCEYFTCIETSPRAAVYETKRQKEPTPTRLAYTIEDAARAGLVNKQNWKSHPAAMLRARCSYQLARDVYPDVVANLYDPDEVEDMREAAAMTPTSPAPAKPTAPPPPAPTRAAAPAQRDEAQREAARRAPTKDLAPTPKREPMPDSPPPEAREKVERIREQLAADRPAQFPEASQAGEIEAKDRTVPSREPPQREAPEPDPFTMRGGDPCKRCGRATGEHGPTGEIDGDCKLPMPEDRDDPADEARRTGAFAELVNERFGGAAENGWAAVRGVIADAEKLRNTAYVDLVIDRWIDACIMSYASASEAECDEIFAELRRHLEFLTAAQREKATRARRERLAELKGGGAA